MLIFVYTSTNFYNIVIQIKDLYALYIELDIVNGIKKIPNETNLFLLTY